MPTSSTIRHRVTALFVALTAALCQTVISQNSTHYFRLDRHMLESMIKTGIITREPSMLIVSPEGDMALPLYEGTNTFAGVKVTVEDDYVSLDKKMPELLYALIPESDDMSKVKIMNQENDMYLEMSLLNKLTVAAADKTKTYFTIGFSDTDEHSILLQSTNRNNEVYGIEYDSTNQKFLLSKDLENGVNLYCLDDMNFKEATISYDNDNSNLEFTFSPLKESVGLANLKLKYLLNNGEEVSLPELLDSDNAVDIKWKKSGDSYTLTLPAYDQDATTLWAIVSKTNNGQEAPRSAVYRSTYADDISTLHFSVSTNEEDATPAYYTLQGIRVSEPNIPGIYLRRQGTGVVKLLIR